MKRQRNKKPNQTAVITQEQRKIRYFIYARKSNESEDRQVQSIPDQIRELENMANKLGLDVVEVLSESVSAKAPGRQAFTKMIERINRGEADGIIAWKLNRLARNPIDGGTVSWLLQQGIIKHIQTHDRSYYPSDNVLFMAVELGMANQYVRDLSVDTKRGLRTRENEKGYPNGVAPMGFLNDFSKEPGDRGWVVDQDRFPLVREMLCSYNSGRYSMRQIMDMGNNTLGLRTPMHKKQGGKKLVHSYVAGTLLRNPVYAGFFFVGDGTRRELNKDMPRMISEEMYWENQRLMQSKGRPRPSKNIEMFPYKESSVCGCCEGSITADPKEQLICSGCKWKFSYPKKTHCPRCNLAITKMVNPTYLYYAYYHCTKKKDPDCKEGGVERKVMDKYLKKHFEEKLEISPALSSWCIRNMSKLDEKDKQTDSEKKESLEKTLAKKNNELREVILMKARTLLTEQEFTFATMPLKAEIRDLETELGKLAHVGTKGQNKAEKPFSVAAGIGKVFESGSPEERKEVLMETGSNLVIKDRTPSIYHNNLYSALVNGLLAAKMKNPQFEPRNIEDTSSRNEVFMDVCPTLLRG